MMYNVPDTAFGAAVATFLLLLQQRPVTLAELHAAFDDMAAVAARDHPAMPWLMKQTDGDGQECELTVDGWLALLRRPYTSLPLLGDAAVLEKLALWYGAQAKVIITGQPWPAELQIHFTKKLRTTQGKIFTEQLGALVVPCSWKLIVAGEYGCRLVRYY